MIPPDLEARKRALTDFETNLLVEAAAGTGKTSLLAGRIAMMLASGINPANIAAITFTELAASELEARIRWTVDELRSERLPPALNGVVTLPFSSETRDHLDAAAQHLGEMTVSTIHGFCQGLLLAHGVDVGLDPGARVVETITADAIFSEVLDTWLKEKLSDRADESHPVAILARSDPMGIVKRLRELADLKREHRDGKAPLPKGHAEELAAFLDAVEVFSRWYASHPGSDKIAGLIGDLEVLAGFYAAKGKCDDFAGLWDLTQPPRIPIMLDKGLNFRSYERSATWKGTFDKDEGRRRAAAAEGMFDQVASAFRGLIGAIAEQLVHQVSAALDEVSLAYANRKREIAALDFEDLLRFARSLVCEHAAIRASLAVRYNYLLVDEFQDTDPIQTEIVFFLAAATQPPHWTKSCLRPGALFVVGDPKQAIYRFRGADIEVYDRAKSVIKQAPNGCVLDVTANFRSRPLIIDHINQTFRQTLSARDQPGFVPLQATVRAPNSGIPSAVRVTVETPRLASADEQRDAEAARVAEICDWLIGSVSLVDGGNGSRSIRAGDIALLAPAQRDLWRYEKALETRGISVSSQAGYSLFRRQETQDILMLVRTLADALDTTAFGALMRGPIVGLSDEELLDITQDLQPDGDGLRRFQIRANIEEVNHPLAKDVLRRLQELYRLVPQLTPMQLLELAIERLNLRVVMAARHRHRNARAIANLDAIIELARPYGVSGLSAFALALQRGWDDKKERRQAEGRVDPSIDAVEIVTMHSAKGLEWPIVIPINSSSQFKPPTEFIYRQSDQTLHWRIGGIEPPSMKAAREEEESKEARQRERLWYVATTRARDLLIIPSLPGANEKSWSRVMDLGQSRLPEIPLQEFPEPRHAPPKSHENLQTAEIFEEEAEHVRGATADIAWDRPSQRDADGDSELQDGFVVDPDTPYQEPVRGAGSERGNILHKLMEELLTGEITPTLEAIRTRSCELLEQLLRPEVERRPDPQEMAKVALRTYTLPELSPYLGQLVPELPLWSAEEARYLAGRADAVAMTGEGISLVIDWKSDVDPKPSDRRLHAAQLRDYLRVTNAKRGCVVYMSRNEIVWVEA